MKIFSSFDLKIIAIITMVADHVGFIFFPDQILWRLVGRISFPVFAFLIAEGHRRTRSENKYLFRLFLLALISQAPFYYFLKAGGEQQVLNIFFTLSAGLLALMAIKRLPVYFSIPATAAIALAAELLKFDYGAYGVIVIIASSILLNTSKPAGATALFVTHLIRSFVYPLRWAIGAQIFALPSIILVTCYNGKAGYLLSKWIFYSFYPVHITLLLFLWYFFGK